MDASSSPPPPPPGAEFVPHEVLALAGHTSGITALCLRHDGTLLLSAAADGEVRAWHPTSGAALGVWRGHRKAVWALAFSHDGAWAFSAGSDRCARVWRASDGACEAVLEGAHTRDILCLAADQPWSGTASGPAGAEAALFTGGADGALHAWRVGGTGDKRPGGGASTSAATSGASAAAAAAAAAATATGPGAPGVAPLASARGAHAGALRALLRAPSGALFSAGGDGVVKAWALGSSAHGGAAHAGAPPELTCTAVMRGHTGAVHALAFHTTHAVLYSACDDATVRAWATHSGACLAVLRGHGGGVRALALRRDGQTLVSAAADGRAAVWRGAHGEGAYTAAAPRFLDGHAAPLRCCVVSERPRGAAPAPASAFANASTLLEDEPASNDCVVFTASLDGALRRWRAADGACTAELNGHVGAVAAMAVSRRGGALFSGGADGRVRVWALAPPPAPARGCGDALRAQHARVVAEVRAGVAGAAHAALRAVSAPMPRRGATGEPVGLAGGILAPVRVLRRFAAAGAAEEAREAARAAAWARRPGDADEDEQRRRALAEDMP
jgi:WD40 repeat protein